MRGIIFKEILNSAISTTNPFKDAFEILLIFVRWSKSNQSTGNEIRSEIESKINGAPCVQSAHENPLTSYPSKGSRRVVAAAVATGSLCPGSPFSSPLHRNPSQDYVVRLTGR